MSHTHTPPTHYEKALRDFRKARRQAMFKRVMARLTGESTELLSYEAICKQLYGTIPTENQGVQEIELEKIRGSVGRYNDYTRDFLPMKDSDAERWARVRASIDDMGGWSPIEVYQVGELYFVIDGNHRVSVARQLGVKTIAANVMKVDVDVPLSVDEDPTEVLEDAALRLFHRQTNFDKLYPDANLQLTFFSQYRVLLDSIAAHGNETGGDGAFSAETVRAWYETVYSPIMTILHNQGAFRTFPDRTEADMFVLLTLHGAELSAELGWELDAATVATDLTEQTQAQQVGWLRKLRRSLIPEDLADGPEAGEWRKTQLGTRPSHLFADILIGIGQTDDDWQLVLNAIEFAQREGSRLLCIHVAEHEAIAESRGTKKLGERFYAACAEANIEGKYHVEVGSAGNVLIHAARWVDLVLTNLTGPFEQSFLGLNSGLARLIQKCPRPLLALPVGSKPSFTHAVLGYDDSPKAKEGLYVTNYLAQTWGLDVSVVTVPTQLTDADALDKARTYFTDYPEITVNYHLKQPPIHNALLEVADECAADLMVMGGFGFSPMRYLMLGSTVDEVIRSFNRPILICR